MSYVTGTDIASTLPFAITVAFGIVALLLEVFQRPSFSRGYIAWVSALGYLCAGVAAWLLLKVPEGGAVFSGTAYLDGYTQVLTIAFCIGGAATSLVAPGYLSEQGIDRGEFHALLLFAVGGMNLMVAAGDLMVFFVGLEIMSVAAYALAAYLRRSPRSAEAGMKYFIIGAFASALFLYGVAMVYGGTGTTSLAGIRDVLAAHAAPDSAVGFATTAQHALLNVAGGHGAESSALLTNFGGFTPSLPLVVFGLILIIVAFMVKIAAAPFHMWAPDAYTGAPTPVVGFFAASVKIAGFGALLRVLVVAFFDEDMRMGPYGWTQILLVVSFISMILGNAVAMVQTNVKRMLAYSSVAHAGYMLVAVVAMGYGVGNVDLGAGIIFYAFAYTFGTVGAFGALAWLGRRGQEVETYEDLNGLGFRYPWVGAALSVFMLSSAGIPPAAGFIGKLMLFRAAIEASTMGQAYGMEGHGALLWLAIIGIVASVAGVYYYLRVMAHLYMKKPRRQVDEVAFPGARFAIIACAAATLFFGILPGRLVDLSQRAMGQMADRPDGVYVTADDDIDGPAADVVEALDVAPEE